MDHRLCAAALAVFSAMAGVAGAQESEGIDEVLSMRFPGSEVRKEDRVSYDEAVFPTGTVDNDYVAASTIELEGETAAVRYRVPVDASTLETFRAYEKELEDAGFAPLYSCDDDACGRLRIYLDREVGMSARGDGDDQRYGVFERTEGGERLVVGVYATKRGKGEKADNFVFVHAAATGADERELETVSADEMGRLLDEEGTVAIYGLEFETDSANLLPSSRAVVAEMASYLSDNPDEKVILVGHTDNEGSLEYNMTLSEERADAVRQSLIADHGIAAARLSARGVGFLAPKATNTTEAGRAENRRVEMVRR